MKKFFSFIFSLFLMFGMLSSVNAAPRHSIDFSGKGIAFLAVLPYINNSGDTSNYVMDDLRNGYTEYFAKEGFKIVEKEDVSAALTGANYSENDNVIASEEVLKSVAETVNSDFVIAMEVEEILITRDDEFPKTKLTAKVKLLYEIYNKSTDKVYQFRITTKKDNKGSFAEVGPKYAVNIALDQALERGNHRLIEIINGKTYFK